MKNQQNKNKHKNPKNMMNNLNKMKANKLILE